MELRRTMELINETQAKNIKYTHFNFDIKEYKMKFFARQIETPLCSEKD